MTSKSKWFMRIIVTIGGIYTFNVLSHWFAYASPEEIREIVEALGRTLYLAAIAGVIIGLCMAVAASFWARRATPIDKKTKREITKRRG